MAKNFRALAKIHHKAGKDDEEIVIHPGAVFTPDDVGMDQAEARRLRDRGHIEESDLEPWDDPTVLKPGSATVRGPWRPDAHRSVLITPTFAAGAPEPAPVTTTLPDGEQPSPPARERNVPAPPKPPAR